MLWLKRNRYFNEWIKDDYNVDEIIAPGEYYYQDDETGKCISCRRYWELKKAYIEDEDNNPYQPWLDAAETQRDYKKTMQEKEAEYLQGTVLNQTIASKYYQ